MTIPVGEIYILTTVEPPNKGQLWDQVICPLNRGVPYSEGQLDVFWNLFIFHLRTNEIRIEFDKLIIKALGCLTKLMKMLKNV